MIARCRRRLPLCTLILFGIGIGADAENFLLAEGDDVIGTSSIVQTRYEDTFTDVARRFGLGYEEIVRANPGVDPWLPGEGTEVVLPTRFVLPENIGDGLVINLAEYRMYYLTEGDAGQQVVTFPISIGRMDWATPLGWSKVVDKVHKPSWYPPESVRREYAAEGRELERVVPPGPDNPLGDYAMRLSIPGYLIHGTNRPAGVGMRVTHGCIRMYPEDIERLFPQVALDTRVQILNQPYKLGWLGDDLYLEVHPPLVSADGAEAPGLTAITQLYVRATRDRPARIDWDEVHRVFREHRGIAVRVGSAETAAVADAGI
ncbi:MAG: L,D-transpeptidase family protein, partial [Pseudomonadales bacterium]|nr:L,D-transpeptidase family protein [Pseudomonadales bacterium]